MSTPIENNTEELRNILQQVNELPESGGNANYVTKVASGEVVTINPVPGTTAGVVSKVAVPVPELSWRTSHFLYLRHIRGKNLYDFAKRFGGVGTVVEIDGITATINENGTATVKGTNATSGYVDILRVTNNDANAGDWHWVFPAGTYTVGTGLTVRPATIGLTATSPGNKQGTFTMDEPFFINTAYISIRPEATVDMTVPLIMVSGNSLPSSGFAFDGEVHIAQFVNDDINCEFNWQTGELKDADGNVIETIEPFADFPVLEGNNTFMTGMGATTVTYTAYGNSSSDSGAVEGFAPEVWGLPVLYLNGNISTMDKDNAVTLNYIYGVREGTCTVKWQGASSLAYPKKNYTIKFDTAFEAKEGWGEQNKYCLKANWIDHSHSRNIVNARLWGQIVKSRSSTPARQKNLINGGAIDGFPILIVMNGEFLGLYTFNIPKDGWMLGMGESSVETIVCASGNTSGRVVEGFKQPVTAWNTGFDLEYIGDESDENKAAMMQSLNNLINACINSDGTDLDTTIAQYLDWDSAIDYWIFTFLVMGHDMYTKNYLLHTYDGIKWYFDGYDMDCTHGLDWDGTSWKRANYYPYPGDTARHHRLFELISLHKKDVFKSRYAVIKEQIMSEDNLYFEFTNFAGQIPKPVYMQDAKKWPLIPNTSTNDIAQILNYYRMRIAQVDKWIEEI